MSISDAELREKLSDAFKTDDNFINELESAENGTKMKEVLSRRGIDVTEEEAEQFIDQMKMKEKSELSEDEMDGVAGGITLASAAAGAVIFGGLYWLARGFRDGRKC